MNTTSDYSLAVLIPSLVIETKGKLSCVVFFFFFRNAIFSFLMNDFFFVVVVHVVLYKMTSFCPWREAFY